MVDLVKLARAVYIRAHVVVYVLEVRVVPKVSDVLQRAGEKVVHAHYAVTLAEEPLAEVTTDKASPARDQRPRFSHEKDLMRS